MLKSLRSMPCSGRYFPAGRSALIDRAGLKNYSVGGATVSELHANFVTAEPGRTAADDILAVLEHIEQTVADRFGVQLQRELVVWP